MNNGFYEFSRGKQQTTSSVFPYTGSASISGSLTVTGSISATQGFTGSLFGTASWATNAITASYITASNVYGPFGANSVVSASFAISASWAPTQTINTSSLVTTSSFNAFTSSYNTGSFTGSFRGDGSGLTNLPVQNINTSSLATTGSNTFRGNQIISGSLNVTGSITGSLFGTASVSTNIVVTDDTATDAIYYPILSPSSSGAVGARVDSTVLTYNPNTNTLTTGDLALEAGGSRTITMVAQGGGGTEINLQPNSTAGYARINVGNTNRPLDFQMNSIDVMRITQAGDIGIGTIEPNAKLDVNGNAILTGSLTVTNGITGSLFGTASWATNAITASYALNGGVTQLLAGPNVTLSPTNGLGQVTISSTGGGGSSFNTATGSYGSFYDTTTQTNLVANIPRSMSLNETDITNGVSVSGSTNPFNTYIKTENAGVYDIQFSAQLDKTDGGADEIVIWLRKNGINLTDTATTITLVGNNGKQVAAWNWFVNSAANDYYQIIWQSADTQVRLLAEPQDGHPGIPSVIVTVNRVDQFLSNTGSFSGSFTGAFSGSGANLSEIPASAITGLNLSQIATGSVTASVSPTQFTVSSGSSTELVVTGTGVTLGSALTDTHNVTGSLNITGSISATTYNNLINSLETFNRTQGVYFFEDFMGNLSATFNNTPNGIINSVGNGQGTTRSTSTITNRTNQQGVVESLTSANATGTAGYYYANGVYKGSGAISIETYINFTTLSILGERFWSLFGFYTGANFTNPANFIVITYDEGGAFMFENPSPNFKCVSRAASGTRTTTITSIPVIAGQWYRLRINISNDGGTVTFFIDNTLVGTHSTNIPTNATFLPIGSLLQKSSGVAARAMQTDYFMYKEIFTTPR